MVAAAKGVYASLLSLVLLAARLPWLAPQYTAQQSNNPRTMLHRWRLPPPPMAKTRRSAPAAGWMKWLALPVSAIPSRRCLLRQCNQPKDAPKVEPPKAEPPSRGAEAWLPSFGNGRRPQFMATNHRSKHAVKRPGRHPMRFSAAKAAFSDANVTGNR